MIYVKTSQTQDIHSYRQKQSYNKWGKGKEMFFN